MKKSVFSIVVVMVVAFAGNLFAQTQQAAKAAGQDAVKKTEIKKDETKAVAKEKVADPGPVPQETQRRGQVEERAIAGPVEQAG